MNDQAMITREHLESVVLQAQRAGGGMITIGGKDAETGVTTASFGKQVNFTPVGAPGTLMFSGFITDDYEETWKVLTRRVDVIEKMLNGDATVKACQLALELPIKGAHWEVKPGHTDSKSKQIAEFIEENLFENMWGSWQGFLTHALQKLPYGFMLFEQIHKRRNGNIVLDELAPRLPKSVFRWYPDQSGRRLLAVEQRVYKAVTDKTTIAPNDRNISFIGSGYYFPIIPASRLLHLTYRKFGANFEGNSILRSAYKHWFYKDKLYLIQGIGLERNSGGQLIIHMPENFTKESADYVKKLLKSWRVHEEDGLLLPPGYESDFAFSRFNNAAVGDAIRHHDAEIAKSILAPFIGLGTDGRTGTFALSKDQSDFFLMVLQSIADELAQEITDQVIKPLVDYNWGGVQKYPKLICSKIAKLDSQIMLSVLTGLTGSGIIKADEDLDEWVRERFDLPEKSAEQKKIDIIKKKQQDQMEQIQIQSQLNSSQQPSLAGEGSSDDSANWGEFLKSLKQSGTTLPQFRYQLVDSLNRDIDRNISWQIYVFANPYRDPNTGQFSYKPGGIFAASLRESLTRTISRDLKSGIKRLIKFKLGDNFLSRFMGNFMADLSERTSRKLIKKTIDLVINETVIAYEQGKIKGSLEDAVRDRLKQKMPEIIEGAIPDVLDKGKIPAEFNKRGETVPLTVKHKIAYRGTMNKPGIFNPKRYKSPEKIAAREV